MLEDGTETYLYGNGRIAQYGANEEYFLGDALGSVRQLVDDIGKITLARDYEPYGEVLQTAGDGTTSYAFTGEWEDNTSMIYLRARYYAPWQGRFITRDAWGGDNYRPLSYNAWIYAGDDPVMKVNPSGNYWVSNRKGETNWYPDGNFLAFHLILC